MGSTNARSAAKVIMWETISLFILIVVSWLILRDPVEVGKVTIVYKVVTTIVMYWHERFWKNYITWGKT